MGVLFTRMLRAAKLDPQLYEEVEADYTALRSAMLVVVLASIAAGLGTRNADVPIDLILGAVAALVGWFVWALSTYVIGARMLPEPQTDADLGQLLRTIGFAASPGLIRVFGFLPGIGNLFNLVGAAWMLVAMVIAVRQALDYRSTGRAVAVCALGWVAQLIVVLLIGIVFGIAWMGSGGEPAQ